MKWTAAIVFFLTTGVLFAQGPAGSNVIAPREIRWDPFLDTLQGKTVEYFLEQSDPATGLTKDRAPSPSPSSIAAIGFALTVYPVAAERGIITRAQAAQRTFTTLRNLYNLPQGPDRTGVAGHHGLFYHFLRIDDGLRNRKSELSTIDTGLLMAGVLFCQSYFGGDSPAEKDIRALADSLYRRVDWKWAMGNAEGLMLEWTPEKGFSQHTWRGYNEAMIMYILALGSPTHPLAESVWKVWTSSYVWGKYYGEEFVSFGPLFGHQYSHCWIDYRGIKDEYMRARGLDYFENSRRATYSQRAYAVENPGQWKDYSQGVWGVTACDGPGDTVSVLEGKRRGFWGYRARGVSFDWVGDDGTIAPTAAGGSVAFAPEICIPALKVMRERYGDRVWRRYGFIDAFNPTFRRERTDEVGWFSDDYIGIDQGPIVIMIENLRNEFVWNVMKKNRYIVEGLRRAGFTGGWLDSVRP